MHLPWTCLPQIFIYSGQKYWSQIIPSYLDFKKIPRFSVASDNFAWSLFVRGKQGFLYYSYLYLGNIIVAEGSPLEIFQSL